MCIGANPVYKAVTTTTIPGTWPPTTTTTYQTVREQGFVGSVREVRYTKNGQTLSYWKINEGADNIINDHNSDNPTNGALAGSFALGMLVPESSWTQDPHSCEMQMLSEIVNVCTEAGTTVPVYSEAEFDADQIHHHENAVINEVAIREEFIKQTLRSRIAKEYAQACFANARESFELFYTPYEYHYTLYYYDQAGNLVQTVPPEGVEPLTPAQVENFEAAPTNPNHRLKTRYAYNTLGQPSSQQTPDAGKTRFFYDQNGQLRLSQNAQQKIENKFAFTRYDAQSRIVEVGVIQTTESYATLTQQIQNPAFPDQTSDKSEITQTLYDYPTAEGDDALEQTYLRGRVSSVAVMEDGQNVSSRTTYAYDVHGNVATLWQKLPELTETEIKEFASFDDIDPIVYTVEAQKRIDYVYDLISGKVNKVCYQDGKNDAFYHRYRYDADNRLISVKTSRDNWLWNEEAVYRYYAHGPLARTEIGEYKVQGLDYYYTIQGWLKGVNNPLDTDIGQDGADGTHYKHVNTDAFAFSLDYFTGDYKAINSTQTFATTAYTSLYNGNIGAMTTELSTFEAQTMVYRYDQLNRIKTAHSQSSATSYASRYSYDANGNILSLSRRNKLGALIDDLQYDYNTLLNNRLHRVHDLSGDPTGVAGNQTYSYDAIGNLTSNPEDDVLSIEWNTYGKIASVTKSEAQIFYQYDAIDNRSLKKVIKNEEIEGEIVAITKKTHYLRDVVH
ncbi:MAG: RHS repeat protein [Bernardetiaceae bacterium]|nr:RHS repeat protein [Bernardetiaceae bacterium]